MPITYSELFALLSLIVLIIDLIVYIYDNKKELTAPNHSKLNG